MRRDAVYVACTGIKASRRDGTPSVRQLPLMPRRKLHHWKVSTQSHVKTDCRRSLLPPPHLARYCFHCRLFVCLFVKRITKKLRVHFHEIWRIGRVWTAEELIEFWKVEVRTERGLSCSQLMWKLKWSWENQLRLSSGKSKPVYLLLDGNDTVPTLCQY